MISMFDVLHARAREHRWTSCECGDLRLRRHVVGIASSRFQRDRQGNTAAPWLVSPNCRISARPRPQLPPPAPCWPTDRPEVAALRGVRLRILRAAAAQWTPSTIAHEAPSRNELTARESGKAVSAPIRAAPVLAFQATFSRRNNPIAPWARSRVQRLHVETLSMRRRESSATWRAPPHLTSAPGGHTLVGVA